MGRNQIDEAVKEAGKGFRNRAVRTAQAWLPKAAAAAAIPRGLDPAYLLFTIIQDEAQLVRTLGRRAPPLVVARRFYVAGGGEAARNPTVPPAEKEQDVDDALAEVAREAGAGFVGDLGKDFVAVAKPLTSQVQQGLAEILGRSVTQKHARTVLIRDLAARLKDHPYWFKNSETLHKALNLLFDVP